ncbi:27983_t:CDS:2, partial [Racocetra persica]
QDGKDNPLNDINISAVGSAARVLNKISNREGEASDQKQNTSIESKPASSKTTKVTPPVAGSKPKKLPYNAAAYTRGLAAASFTSTAMTPVTVNENALIDEDEFMFKEIKAKGYVRITTNLGNLNVELFCDKSPRACFNFIMLSKQEYYNGTIFHRKIKNFMIQGGDPTGTGKGGESYWKKDFVDEFKSNLSHNERGLLSMANRGKNTNSSQLPCVHLDNKHTIFGKLVGGKDVLDKMESVPTDDSDRPLNEIKIVSINVFVDPYEDYKKNLEKKLNRQSAETPNKKPRKNEKDSTTNWFGNKLASSSSISKEDN